MTSTAEWAAWVATKMEQIRQEPAHATDIAKTVQVEALSLATRPPRDLLGMVQFQHDMNGKTWPRAWALSLWVKGAHLYYRRKR